MMDREEVIQMLITLKKQSRISENGTFVEDIKPSSFVFVINSAIEALRKETQWIPVSERLPEKSDLYLICFNNGESELSYFDGYSFDYTGVIAWIPIPEPYKEGE